MAANLAGGITFDDGGCFAAAGSYLQRAILGPVRFEIDPVPASGVLGQGTTNFGYRGQQVTLDVMYVNTDADSCFADAQADNESLGAAVFSGSVQGINFYACKLLDFRTGPRGARGTGLGTAYLEATIVFDGLRQS